MASLGLANLLLHSKRRDAPASLDGPDEVVVKNIEEHLRNSIAAMNARQLDSDGLPGFIDGFQTINPTGGRPPASCKAEALAIMKQIFEDFSQHRLEITSLSTTLYEKENEKFADVFMNGEVTGAQGLPVGVWRPLVSVWTYQQIGGEWRCVSEESIDGIGDSRMAF